MGTIKSIAGVPVTYRTSGSGDPIEISKAVKGSTLYEVDESTGARVRSRSVDWLIDKADLLIDGISVIPEIGHTITDGNTVYEVHIRGETCWRWSDPQETRYRIHVSEISSGE